MLTLHAWTPALLAQVFMPALSLAALLSIDTLKTCVVLDAMTKSHHNPNREMIGQGLGNIGSALLGGIPGAGTMGANKYCQVGAVPCCAVLCCAVSVHVQNGDKIVQPGAMLHWLVGGLLGAVGCWAGTASKHASCWAAFMLH